MSDVSINIRGRDDGAGRVIDNLRDKLVDLAETQDKVNSRDVRDIINEDFDVRKDTVREEFNNARKANFEEYNESRDLYDQGRISQKEFDNIQKEFAKNNKELDDEEKSEVRDLQIEQNAITRELLEEFVDSKKRESDRRQRDDSEFDENGESRDDGLRVFVTNWPGNANFGSSGSGDSGSSSSNSDNSRGEYERGQFGAGFRQTALGVARGDLTSTLMGGTEMAGSLIGGKAGKAFTIAGLIAMIIKEAAGHGDAVLEAIGQTASMRGGSASAADFNSVLRGLIQDEGDTLAGMGLTNDEFASMVNEKAMASGRAGNDVVKRTLDDVAFQKGFGADVGMFSQFERFTKNQETATTIGLDVLNTLINIDRSSLKSNDLSTLTEKMQSQNTILALQRSKRDVVDNESALKLLAAYERVGLSDKGDRAGDFLSRTIQGLGEGGSENEMLLKYQAARMARPDLANDPAALRRFVRFNSDDPTYQAEFFKFAKNISGGSQLALDDILMTMFNPSSEKDLDIYSELMNNRNGALGTLTSKDRLSGVRGSTTDLNAAYNDATNATGDVTELMKTFSNSTQESMDLLKELVKGVFIKNWPASTNKNEVRKGN